MSGLEIFGAVAAAVTLLDVAKKFATRLERYDNVHRDIAALETRVRNLAVIVDEISVVLSDVRSQQQDGVTTAEAIIWRRMDAVLVLCTDRLTQLDSGLDYILSRGSRSRLSAVPSDISRRMKDLEDYVQALIMLKGLFQM
jgi:predicted phage-related endonuclease